MPAHAGVDPSSTVPWLSSGGGHMEDWTATLPVRRRRPGRIALIVVGTVVGVCCISSGSAAPGRPALVPTAMPASPTADQRAADTQVQGPAPARPGLGDAVRDGQFEFVVRSVG